MSTRNEKAVAAVWLVVMSPFIALGFGLMMMWRATLAGARWAEDLCEDLARIGWEWWK